MKVLILVLLSFGASAQHVRSIALTFVSGMADGTAEALKWHYDRVDQRYNLNDSYWNPAISYKNKYAGGITANGPKFPGSTTYLVWTTDGYHMLRMVRNTSMVATVIIHPYKKKKWWKYVVESAAYYGAYTIGFNISYR